MNRKKPLFAKLFRAYVRRRMRASFDAVRVNGLDALRARIDEEPVIVAVNHSSWWDALFLILLDGVEGIDAFCLMDAANLRDLPFFGWLGAVPLDRSHPRRAHADLARAASLLDRPGRVLFIFPSGRQVPPHLPLHFSSGVAHLARKTGASVIPMGMRYDYREEPYPELNVSIGSPLAPEPAGDQLLTRIESAVRAELTRIDEHLLGDDPGFVALLSAPRRRVSKGARLLALLAREGASNGQR